MSIESATILAGQRQVVTHEEPASRIQTARMPFGAGAAGEVAARDLAMHQKARQNVEGAGPAQWVDGMPDRADFLVRPDSSRQGGGGSGGRRRESSEGRSDGEGDAVLPDERSDGLEEALEALLKHAADGLAPATTDARARGLLAGLLGGSSSTGMGAYRRTIVWSGEPASLVHLAIASLRLACTSDWVVVPELRQRAGALLVWLASAVESEVWTHACTLAGRRAVEGGDRDEVSRAARKIAAAWSYALSHQDQTAPRTGVDP